MSAVKKQKTALSKADNLVFGLGVTGMSVARYLKRNGIDAIFVDSRNDPPALDDLLELLPDADVVLGENAVVLLTNINRIIASPGVPDSEPLLTMARKAGIDVVSDIEIFAADAPAKIVAVTGSNGKSTVTTILALMCDAAGKSAVAGANLGEPALDLLEQDEPDFYVLELSSFQLQRTSNLNPMVAVLLNISADHLDWHQSEKNYREAKYRIFKNAAAVVINRADPDVSAHVAKATRTISFGSDAPEDGHYGLVEEDGIVFLARGEQLLLSTLELALVGRHNQLNALAALAAGELMGLELSAMLQVLPEFPGLPHRMQLIARKGGVEYINDSKATNVGAAIASVESIDGSVVLIAGGEGKGADFVSLANALSGRLRAAVLIGEDADQLADALADLAPILVVEKIDEAVRQAAGFSESGDTVLLAPACASLDQFPNYAARGDAFATAVLELSA